MIQTVIEHINQSIQSLNIFREHHGLCELIKSDGVTFPAAYCANGEYMALKLDNACAEIYHRHGGIVARQEVNEQAVAGDTLIRQTYPMTLIAFLSRNRKGNDGPYLPDEVSINVVNAMEFRNNKELNQLLKATLIRVRAKSYNVDFNSIFNREFNGNDLSQLNTQYLLLEIKYDIIIEGNKSCFEFVCKN